MLRTVRLLGTGVETPSGGHDDRHATMGGVDDEGRTWQHREGDAAAVRLALRTRDAEMLNGLMAAIPFTGASAAEVEAEVRRALAEQTHDTQRWWAGTCTCHPEQPPGA